MLWADQFTTAHHICVFNGVLKLSDISGPVVEHENCQPFLRNTCHRSSEEAVETLCEVMGQQRNIFLAIPQWR